MRIYYTIYLIIFCANLCELFINLLLLTKKLLGFRQNKKSTAKSDAFNKQKLSDNRGLSCFLSETAFNKINKTVNSSFFVSAVGNDPDLSAANNAK